MLDAESRSPCGQKGSPRNCRAFLNCRLVQVFEQETFVERGVVVIIVAASAGAGVEGEILVAGTILKGLLMTVEAVVIRHGHPERARPVRVMLAVTRHAIIRFDEAETVCVARIGELAFRMRVVGVPQLRRMAIITSFFLHSHPRGVARAAIQFDLVMP